MGAVHSLISRNVSSGWPISLGFARTKIPTKCLQVIRITVVTCEALRSVDQRHETKPSMTSSREIVLSFRGRLGTMVSTLRLVLPQSRVKTTTKRGVQI